VERDPLNKGWRGCKPTTIPHPSPRAAPSVKYNTYLSHPVAPSPILLHSSSTPPRSPRSGEIIVAAQPPRKGFSKVHAAHESPVYVHFLKLPRFHIDIPRATASQSLAVQHHLQALVTCRETLIAPPLFPHIHSPPRWLVIGILRTRAATECLAWFWAVTTKAKQHS
jgi:hypothetical protein